MAYNIVNAAKFDALMLKPHWLTIRVELGRLDGTQNKDLSSRFYDGGVVVDAEAETTRALDLTLFDPARKIALDPDTPSATGVYISDEVKITYIIDSPDYSEHYEVPVFTGPIDDVERDEALIKIKALGNEKLGLSNAWVARSFRKNSLTIGVIKDLLWLMGFRTWSIANTNDRIQRDEKLTIDISHWQLIKKLVRAAGRFIFFAGDGVPTMIKRSSNIKFTFSEKNITSKIRVAYDLERVKNTIQVVGQANNKRKDKIIYTAYAHPAHKLSPQSLGKPAAPRYLWEKIENTNYRSVAVCRQVALARLKQGLAAGVDVNFTAVPPVRAQEYDMARIDADGTHTNFIMTKFTIPLVAGEDSSIGTLALKQVGAFRARATIRVVKGKAPPKKKPGKKGKKKGKGKGKGKGKKKGGKKK